MGILNLLVLCPESVSQLWEVLGEGMSTLQLSGSLCPLLQATPCWLSPRTREGPTGHATLEIISLSLPSTLAPVILLRKPSLVHLWQGQEQGQGHWLAL